MATGYRRLTLSDQLLGLAVERARSLPVFEYSHRKSEANLVGCIGEVVFEAFLRHHDIAFRDDTISTRRDYVVAEGLTLDVKTKDRTVPPRLDYENSVPLYNHVHQRPDYYYFVSLHRDDQQDPADPRKFKEAYLVGGIAIGELDAVAVHRKKGEVDPANGTRFWTDCLNVRMDQLTSNADMLKVFRGKPGDRKTKG